MAIEEVVAGQVFTGRRTSLRAGSASQALHVLGRRPRTKTLVTGLKAVRASHMPSKPRCGRKLPGGFDSRPPSRGEIGKGEWSHAVLRIPSLISPADRIVGLDHPKLTFRLGLLRIPRAAR